jgi:O-antigen/teichoic acid export membrane protein
MTTARAQDREDRAHTLRGARTNFLTLVGQTGMFAFAILAARMFGPVVWGAYTTAFAWIDVLARGALAGGDKALLVFVAARRASGDERGVYRALGTVLRVTAVLALVAVAVMGAGSWLVPRLSHEPLDGLAMRWLAPVVVSTSLATALLAATMATKTLSFNLLAKGVVEPFLMVALVLIFGLTLPRLTTLALVPLTAGAATLSVAAWAVSRRFDLRTLARTIRKDRLDTGVIRYALPLAVAELVNIAMYRMGTFILVAFAPAAERGVYNTCVLLATTVSFVRGAFDTVFAPVAAEAWAQKDLPRLGNNLRRQCQLALLLAVPLGGVYITGGPAVLALFGSSFVHGHRTLAWLALAHIINASVGLTGWVLMAAGRSRLILLNNVILFAVSTALCLVLIPRFGIEGAALATAASITLIQVIQGILAYRIGRAHPFSRGFVLLALLGAAVIGAQLLGFRLIGGPPLARALALTVAGAVIYLVLGRRLITPAAAPAPGPHGQG